MEFSMKNAEEWAFVKRNWTTHETISFSTVGVISMPELVCIYKMRRAATTEYVWALTDNVFVVIYRWWVKYT
jgi:hypothetical protein